MRIVAVVLVSTLVAAPAGAGEKWAALSKAAKEITGDLEIDGDRLSFANGERLVIEPYEMARNGDWNHNGDIIAGDVFKIRPSTPPTNVSREKPLCAGPADYLVLWTFGEGDLTLNFYSGDAAPTGLPEADNICAIYSYEVR